MLLLVGLAGRPAALGIAGIMLGAASTHLSNGFFMNWFGQLPAGAEGFEYHVIVLALSGVVAIEGSGAAALDLLLARRVRARAAVREVLAAARAA